MDRMTNAGTTPMDTYPNSSISLYLQVKTTTEDIKTNATPPNIFYVVVSASNSCPVFPVNTRGREFGFRLIVSNGDEEEQRDRVDYLSWKRKTYMDPTQAMTQMSQRM
ncbi:hypothetical protein NQZ68_034084 [Dissostichus eleginoides]|nr:hypothetical protein NQZ68_034084 [Dissostichus eleginoides]